MSNSEIFIGFGDMVILAEAKPGTKHIVVDTRESGCFEASAVYEKNGQEALRFLCGTSSDNRIVSLNHKDRWDLDRVIKAMAIDMNLPALPENMVQVLREATQLPPRRLVKYAGGPGFE